MINLRMVLIKAEAVRFQGNAACGSQVSLVLSIIAGLTILLVIAAIWSRRRIVRLRVPARLETIRTVMRVAEDLARQAHLDDQAIFHCRLALDEACVNIIRHSYANNSFGEIDVRFKIGRGAITISLTDFGEPYDPSRVYTPPGRSSLGEAMPGGLGLHLIKSVMDDVQYRTGSGRNRLVMVKHSS